MEIDPQYASRIYPNATVLLRPKTGLNDMVAELDPGNAGGGPSLHSGATLSSAQTLPTVSLDEVLAQLDSDTRDELELLISGAGQALGNGGGGHLANVFRRLDPLSRDVETASHLVAQRSVALRRLIGNLSKLATELGGNESQLTAFVKGNEGVFRALAHQDQNLQQTIALLPPALRATNTALTHGDHAGQTLQSTLGELEPSARGAGSDAVGSAAVLHADHAGAPRSAPAVLGQGSADGQAARAGDARPGQGDARPADAGQRAQQHRQRARLQAASTARATCSTCRGPATTPTRCSPARTAIGPVRRSLILFSCGSLQLLQDLAKPKHNPTLATLIQLLDDAEPQRALHHGGPAEE